MKVSTVRALSPDYRQQLESAVVVGRRAAEAASRAALQALGVTDDRVPAHLSENLRVLRRGLRAKLRQLGGEFDLLVAECAYEQWHRLLFARFLAENDLLLHPQYRAPVTITDCEELAPDLGEPDGWSVAARFAAEILPGIFRLDDPCVQLRLAPEGRLALERVVSDLPTQVFKADDSLGWVYQFWQKEKKDEVYASERKIGGADLGPVTQLFTESYMVRFLLENSLGAWWATRYPDSPLVKEFDFLRFGDDGCSPAAGTFDDWPDQVAELTVMDPCCGSGHFLVEAFGMLWRMRAEEEGLKAVAAQNAVLQDNLFGLELDPRCVEIAMFAVALAAWKQGDGWRELPVPGIACSGVPAKASLEEWTALARSDLRLEAALERLHELFGEADTLGSLIDPRLAAEMDDATGQRPLDAAIWAEVAPLLEEMGKREAGDPAAGVLGADAAGIARAADYLSREYTLVTTNPPFLSLNRQAANLQAYAREFHEDMRNDLATVFLSRGLGLVQRGGTLAYVTPQAWLVQPRYRGMQQRTLTELEWLAIARLGDGAFSSFGGAVVNVLLGVWGRNPPRPGWSFQVVDAQSESGNRKAVHLSEGSAIQLVQADQAEHAAGIITLEPPSGLPLFQDFADAYGGITTGDSLRFRRFFWEVDWSADRWEFQQMAPSEARPYAGRECVLLWEDGDGTLTTAAEDGGATIAGFSAWGRQGVALQKMSDLAASIYTGDLFENVAIVVVPKDKADLSAVWQFASSGALGAQVRRVDRSVGVTVKNVLKVPFDADHWRAAAAEKYPHGLPEPWSDDPAQWLFEGRPESSVEPLQVAVGRLLGYRWPGQREIDDLGQVANSDGIVSLPTVAGEPPAAERLQRMLRVAFGSSWSTSMTSELLERSGSKKKNLAEWLRDDFFKQHCMVFGNRPFIWHIWDGRKDGFSALVNYHQLGRKTLEKLTYTYLGQDWVERQRAEGREHVAGADARLTAALALQRKLEAILDGEPPFDIFVRWKTLEDQPIGWDRDLDDGVRLNIRPFVEAGVLRSKVNVHWRKDRGKDPDGSERHNDLHFSQAEKLDARKKAGRS